MYLKRSPYKVILGGIRAKTLCKFTESLHLQFLFILQRLAFMTSHQFFPACPPFVNTVYGGKKLARVYSWGKKLKN